MKPMIEFSIEDFLVQKMFVVAVDTTKNYMKDMGFEWSDFKNLKVINAMLNFLGADLLFQEFAFPMRHIKTYTHFCIDYLMACIGNPSLEEDGIQELFDSLIKASAQEIPEYLKLLDNGISDFGDGKHDNDFTEYINCFIDKFATTEDRENLIRMATAYINKVNRAFYDFDDRILLQNYVRACAS